MGHIRNTAVLLAAAACLALCACGPGASSDAETFCAALGESNSGCWNDELANECLELHAECGENITVAESCPVQLGCS
jgi:hypothetical protein